MPFPLGFNVDPSHSTLQPETHRHGLDRLFVPFRFGPAQPVIHVADRNPEVAGVAQCHQCMQQHTRIESAGHGHENVTPGQPQRVHRPLDFR